MKVGWVHRVYTREWGGTWTDYMEHYKVKKEN